MSFFHSFTDSLRQKWLQFFQVNRDWINVHMQVESVYTPDGGKRPPSYLILGVVNALEPKLAQLMLPFSKLNPDADTLIEVLDLHFDPDMALGHRVLPRVDSSQYGEESAVVMDEKPQDEALTISQRNGNGSGATRHDMLSDKIDRLEMLDDHEQTLMVPDTTMRDELLAMSLDNVTQLKVSKEIHNGSGDKDSRDEFHSSLSLNAAVDEFGDISFDEFKEVHGKISSETASHENGFADVLSDVWGDEEAVAHEGEANNDLVLGEEELPSGAFDESEIAHLFPNA